MMKDSPRLPFEAWVLLIFICLNSCAAMQASSDAVDLLGGKCEVVS